MIRGSTGRFLTLILAPLFVIGVTALVLLPGRGDDKVTVDADGPVVHIDAPATGSRYSPGPLTVVSTVTDPDGLSTAELRVEGKRVARVTLSGSSEETTQFTWTPTRAGEYELSVRARDLNGAWGAADEVTVEIETDDVALPPPPTYASTTTVAATDPATAPPIDSGVALPAPVIDPATTSPDGTLLPPLLSPRPTSRSSSSSAATTRPPAPRPAGSPATPGTPGTPAATAAPEPVTAPPVTAPPTTLPPCVVPRPTITSPRNGATGLPQTPLVVTWDLTTTCPVVAQELQILSASRTVLGAPVLPVRIQIAISGTARQYTLTRVLPPCTPVTIRVVAYDALQRASLSSTKTVVTTGPDACLPPTTTVPTTTTTLPPVTDPPTTTTTSPPPTDPPPTDPPPTDPPVSPPPT
jgi:hypothetical protein